MIGEPAFENKNAFEQDDVDVSEDDASVIETLASVMAARLMKTTNLCLNINAFSK
jgi:hypothetical protein